jgi:hypothetical protein
MPRQPFPTGLSALRYRYSPVRRFRLKSLREGLLGGNRGWLVAFLTFQGLVAAKRALSRQQERVVVDLLKPGERMLIRTIPVSSGKERKRLMRGR